MTQVKLKQSTTGSDSHDRTERLFMAKLNPLSATHVETVSLSFDTCSSSVGNLFRDVGIMAGTLVPDEFDISLDAIQDKVGRRVRRQQRKLMDLRSLPSNWDSYGAEPPSQTAIANASLVLDALELAGIEPRDISACADGGVSLVLCSPGHTVLIECYNSGEIVLGESSDAGGVKTREIHVDEISQSIEGVSGNLAA